MTTKTLLVFLIVFKYVLLFDIKNCSDSNLKFEPIGKLEMGCTSSTYFGYCTIKDIKSSHTCTYIVYNNLVHGYRGHRQKNCDYFPHKVNFVGDPGNFNCEFEFENITTDVGASWEITMEDWGKQNSKSSYPFSLLPINETGCIDKGFKIVGHDLDILKFDQPSWKKCQLNCQSYHNCSFWSYVTAGQRQGTCKLTTGSVSIEASNDTISGSKECDNCFRLDENLNETEKYGLSSCSKFIGGNAEENQSSLGLILGLVSFFLVLICTTSVGVWYYLKKRQTEEINYDENSVCLRTLNKSRKSLPFTTFFSRTNHEYEDVNCECSNCKGKRGTQDLGYNYQAYPSGCNQESSSGCNQESPPPFYINEPDINASAPPVPNRAKKPPVPS